MTVLCITFDENTEKYVVPCKNSIKRFFPSHPPIVTCADGHTDVVLIKSTSLVVNPINCSLLTVTPKQMLDDKLDWDDICIIDYSDTPLDSFEFLLDYDMRNISLELYTMYKELCDD